MNGDLSEVFAKPIHGVMGQKVGSVVHGNGNIGSRIIERGTELSRPQVTQRKWLQGECSAWGPVLIDELPNSIRVLPVE